MRTEFAVSELTQVRKSLVIKIHSLWLFIVRLRSESSKLHMFMASISLSRSNTTHIVSKSFPLHLFDVYTVMLTSFFFAYQLDAP